MTTPPPSTEAGAPGCTAPRHGSRWAVDTAGCICPGAREERLQYYRDYRAGHTRRRLVSVVPTWRRLRALNVDGWTLDEIAWRLGYRGDGRGAAGGTVRAWARDGHPDSRISAANAEAVAVLYTQLAGQDGPCDRTRELMRRRGRYAPYWAWNKLDIDDVTAQPWYFGWDIDDWAVEVLVKRCGGQHEPLPPRLTLDDVALAVFEVLDTRREPAAVLRRGFDIGVDLSQSYVAAGGLTERQLRGLATKVRMSDAERARIVGAGGCELGVAS